MKLLLLFLTLNLTNCLDIVVIGAGVSGLKSASLLKAKGHNVKVLEARNRIGGRIDSDTSFGYTLDLGAAWIHGIDKNPIYDLSLTNKIETVSFNYENAKFYSSSLSPTPA